MSRPSSGLPGASGAGGPDGLASNPTRHRGYRLALGGATVALVLLLVADLGQAPTSQLSSRALQRLVRFYQVAVPTLKPFRGHCRLRPNCSDYAIQVLRDHGAGRGSWLAFRRILRCGPWTPAGTKDLPPPPRALP